MSKSDEPKAPAAPQALFAAGFGARLQEARRKAGYRSQPALARALGINPQTVHRHEKETHPPSLEMVRAYARVLHVSPSYLQYGIGDGGQTPRAVLTYLAEWRSHELLEETRARLLAVPWSVITAGELDENQVHALARLIDKNLRKRVSSSDDPSRGMAGARRALSGEPSSHHDDDAGSDDPARPQA